MRYILSTLLAFMCFSASAQKHALLVPYKQDDKYGFSDWERHIVVKPLFTTATPLKNGYAGVTQDWKYGLMDSTGRQTIPTIFKEYISGTSEFYLLKNKGKWMIYTKKGKIIPLPVAGFENYGAEREGVLAVKRKGKFGFINTTGKEVIPCIYDSASYVSMEGAVELRSHSKWAYFTKAGKKLTEFKYDSIESYSHGRAKVYVASKGWGYINAAGKEITPLKYTTANYFLYGVAWVINNRHIDILNNEGKTVVSTPYTSAGYFDNGNTFAGDDKEYTIYNKNGEVVFKTDKYQSIDRSSEGLAAVQDRKGKWGYINSSGKEVVPPQYEEVWWFRNGFASVKSKLKWGFINKEGMMVIPAIYERAYSFEDGLVDVQRNGERFYINTSGDEYITWTGGPCPNAEKSPVKVMIATAKGEDIRKADISKGFTVEVAEPGWEITHFKIISEGKYGLDTNEVENGKLEKDDYNGHIFEGMLSTPYLSIEDVYATKDGKCYRLQDVLYRVVE